MNKLSIEDRLSAIEKRNRHVEMDKAWETGILRRGLITTLTYGVVSVYLLVIDADSPLVTAVVPAMGYFLSTLVVKSAKDWWANR